jgi:predicted GIY-YIG superfamily endonuclease
MFYASEDFVGPIVGCLFGLALGTVIWADSGRSASDTIVIPKYRIYEHAPGKYTIERKTKDSQGEVWVYETSTSSDANELTREKALEEILRLQKERIEGKLSIRMEEKLKEKTEEF